MKINFDLEILTSKHFRNTWMRKWDYDMHDLRNALKESYKLEKVGKSKYEAYTRYKSKKSRKIIFTLMEDSIFIITGAEGK